MKEEATRVGADWDVVMRADASPRESIEMAELADARPPSHFQS